MNHRNQIENGQFLLILLSLMAGMNLAADQACPSQAVSPYRDQADISKLIETVVFVKKSPDDTRDDRRTQNEYAKAHGITPDQAEAMFGATGSLDCGSMSGSANVVIKNNVLLTSAHMFWDSDTCAAISTPESCKFTTIVDQKKVVLKVKSLAKINGTNATGFKCPGHSPHPTDDWAILVLDQPVPAKIVPYKIGDAAQMKVGADVLAVNGRNADFFPLDPTTKTSTWAKSLAPCSWGEVGMGMVTDGLISTSCSGAFLASGSALLNDQHQVVGVLESSSETLVHLNTTIKAYKEAVSAYKKDPVHNKAPGPFQANSCLYDRYTCSTNYNPVQGDLKKALEDLTSCTDI